MENNSIAREDSGSENRCGQRDQTTQSAAPRMPLQDVSNIKTNNAHAPPANGPGRATAFCGVFHDESLLSATIPAVLQRNIFVPATFQLIVGSVEDILTSCFLLPCILCFLSLQTAAYFVNKALEGQFAHSNVSTKHPCRVNNSEESRFYRYIALKEKEMQFRVNPDYLRGSTFFTEQQRSNVLNNMLLFGHLHKLATSSLHLAIPFVDQYMSFLHAQGLLSHLEAQRQEGVQLYCQTPDHLLTIPCTAIWMAYQLEGKQGEFDFRWFIPEISEDPVLLDSVLAEWKEEIASCETRILKALEFGSAAPTAYDFLCELTPIADFYNHDDDILARCIIERAILEYKMLQFPPSVVAVAAVYLTRYLAQQVKAKEELRKKRKAEAPTAATAAPLSASVSVPVSDKSRRKTKATKRGSTAASSFAFAFAPASSSKTKEQAEKVWTAKLQECTGCAEADLAQCVKALLHMFSQEAADHARHYAHGMLEGSELGFSYLALLSALQSKLEDPAGGLSPEQKMYLSYLPGILEYFEETVVQEANSCVAAQHSFAATASITSALSTATTPAAKAPSFALTYSCVGDENAAKDDDFDQLENFCTPGTAQEDLEEAIRTHSQDPSPYPRTDSWSEDLGLSEGFPPSPTVDQQTATARSEEDDLCADDLVLLDDDGDLDDLIATISPVSPTRFAATPLWEPQLHLQAKEESYAALLWADSITPQPVYGQRQHVSRSCFAHNSGSSQSFSDLAASAPSTASTAVRGYRHYPSWSSQSGATTTSSCSRSTSTGFASAANLPDLCYTDHCDTAPTKATLLGSSSADEEALLRTQEGHAYDPAEESALLGMETGGTTASFTRHAAKATRLSLKSPTSSSRNLCKDKSKATLKATHKATLKEKPKARPVKCKLFSPCATENAENVPPPPPPLPPAEMLDTPTRTPSSTLSSAVRATALVAAAAIKIKPSQRRTVSRKAVGHRGPQAATPQLPRVVTLPDHLQDKFHLHPVALRGGESAGAGAVASTEAERCSQEASSSSSSSYVAVPAAAPVPNLPVPSPPLQTILDAAIAQVDQLDVQFNAVYYRYRAVYGKLVLLPPLPSQSVK